MIYPFYVMLFWMVVGHALADYPLQGEFLAIAKNPDTEIGRVFWPHALFAHSMIHAGFVALITGSIVLGLAEAVVHALTDLAKCAGKIGIHTDQLIHFVCKFVWAAIAMSAVLP
jgi:hypothetical protein